MSQSPSGWLSSQTSYMIIDLVGHYPANYLIRRKPLLERKSFTDKLAFTSICGISLPFGKLSPTQG